MNPYQQVSEILNLETYLHEPSRRFPCFVYHKVFLDIEVTRPITVILLISRASRDIHNSLTCTILGSVTAPHSLLGTRCLWLASLPLVTRKQGTHKLHQATHKLHQATHPLLAIHRPMRAIHRPIRAIPSPIQAIPNHQAILQPIKATRPRATHSKVHTLRPIRATLLHPSSLTNTKATRLAVSQP